MGRLNDVYSGANRALHGNRAFTAGGLAITAGGAAATFKTVNTINFIINGIFYAKTAAAAGAFSTDATVYIQPVSTTGYYIVALNAAGTFKTIPGRNGNVVEGPTYGFLPDIADTLCPVGIIKVVTDSTHTFTPGTTNLDAAGLTVTYTDISVIPATAP